MIKQSALAQLLAFAAAPSVGQERPLAVSLSGIGDEHYDQVVHAGLAPMLFAAARQAAASFPPPRGNALHSAYLTSRLRFGALCDATEQVIEVCADHGINVTLLKGMSIADQCYPEGHLRPMGDIDVLVAAKDYAVLESAMLARGYIAKADPDAHESDPHGAPLYHGTRDIWIEVHTGLFSEHSSLRTNGLFGPANIAAHSVASTFHGRKVHRLSDELQLAYIASYWLRDLTRNNFHPSFALPLFDAIYLLKSRGGALDSDALIAQLDNERAAASLYLMLRCLARRGLPAGGEPMIERIASRQRIIGPAELRILLAMLDAFLLGDRALAGSFVNRHPMLTKTVLGSLLARRSPAGKVLALPWNLLFPPDVPGRYSIRYQRNRVARMFKHRA